MTAEEYVELDSDLINANLPTEEKNFTKVGRQALETVKKILEQKEFTTEEDIRYVRDIIRRLDESVETFRHQTLLTEYITQ